jgi:hypothetical protein
MNASTFGPDTLLAEFQDAKNVGWSSWLSEVSSAFLTVDADDPKLASVQAYKGRAHMKIYRDSDLVWAGWWLESDGNERDIVMYGYSYLAGLYWTLTDWDTEYTDTQLDTIVSAQWTRAKTTLTYSMLNWIATGTIQAPVTTSGGSTAIVLPFYAVYFKRALLLMQELAALGASDTTNAVWFEITPAGTFNFWKNKQTDQANVVWEYGGDTLAGYSDLSLHSTYRDVLEGVGASPNDPTLRYEAVGASLPTWGRRMEPVFYSFVRDATEIERITKQRLALAERADLALGLRFFANKIIPPGATGASFALADRVKVRINRGFTVIDDYLRVTGVQVLYLRGNEYVRTRVQIRPGS